MKPTLPLMLFAVLWLNLPVPAEILIPHAQKGPPNPPRTPEEARTHFTVPEGFRVDPVAAEPDVVNPVAMTWDDRGRIWVCESLEYPRLDPGPGMDRIRIHEDANQDGQTDTVKTFAEGLNIPSGIAIGYGGVFVANSPDLLFLQDTDGDDRVDRTEVILSGFGREDVHEVPNNLVWGPDGWLYGLNGVFNPSEIEYRGRTYSFDAALWRYHPIGKEFEIYCEGTSNPWGLDYNRNGDWFVSACVIDHLWHLTQSGYYHRQGGPYRPHVWKLESIVEHKHQMAAYCGLAQYDAEVYPEEYRGDLYMGNIHFGGMNRDRLLEVGSTYQATSAPDFLAGNDAWFMPVSQKVGPDGCFWILDWYDRYHCYQDARRDPGGIDRGRGRIWRVAYGEEPIPEPFDLQDWDSDRLVDTLSHSNVWWRRNARRILTERQATETVPALQEKVLENTAPGSMEALWTLLSMRALEGEFHQQVLAHPNPQFRRWAVHSIGERKRFSNEEFDAVLRLASDESAPVRLETVIAAGRMEDKSALAWIEKALEFPATDEVISHVAWENIHPKLNRTSGEWAEWLLATRLESLPGAQPVASRIVEWLVEWEWKEGVGSSPGAGRSDSNRHGSVDALGNSFRGLLCRTLGLQPRPGKAGAAPSPSSKNRLPNFAPLLEASLTAPGKGLLSGYCLDALWKKLRSDPQSSETAALFSSLTRDSLVERIGTEQGGASTAAWIATLWGNPKGLARTLAMLQEASLSEAQRADSLRALAKAHPAQALEGACRLLSSGTESASFQKAVVDGLSILDLEEVGHRVIETWSHLSGESQRAVYSLLASRPGWAFALLGAIQSGAIPKDLLNTNTAKTIEQHGNPGLSKLLEKTWGRIRIGEDREDFFRDKKFLLTQGGSDPKNGQRVFKKLCSQCHTMYGYGKDVGPDITLNGRSSRDQILSNVLDPNLVIGSGYLATNVWTVDDQILSGILVEEGDQAIRLKLEGGEVRSLPRSEVSKVRTSEVSLMPEGLDQGISEQEFRDLVGFLETTNAPVAWEDLEEEPRP